MFKITMAALMAFKTRERQSGGADGARCIVRLAEGGIEIVVGNPVVTDHPVEFNGEAVAYVSGELARAVPGGVIDMETTAWGPRIALRNEDGDVATPHSARR